MNPKMLRHVPTTLHEPPDATLRHEQNECTSNEPPPRRDSRRSAKAASRRRALIPLMAGILLLAGALGVGLWLTMLKAHAQPSPQLEPEGFGFGLLEQAFSPNQAETEDGFPVVDWEYWQSVNPSMVGWITIPGTTINHPIVQASADDPEFYLSHDIWGNPNPLGCPYLDAACSLDEAGAPDESPASEGLQNRNTVIFGHHSAGGEVFAPLASYGDRDFAEDHKRILIQTPHKQWELSFLAAELVNGDDPVKRTEFAHDQDFSQWWQERLNASLLHLVPSTFQPNHLWTLVTCSYQINPANERILVYASEIESAG